MLFISQPTYLPWIGYFSYLNLCKKVVFLDDVQFNRRSFQQRNKIIKKKESIQYLSVPVKKKGFYNQLLSEVKINDSNFFENHLKIIRHEYSKSKYFSYLYPHLEILNSRIKKMENLSEINILLINKICKILDIKLNFQKSSDLSFKEKKTKKLISICNFLGQKKLLANEGMKSYLLDDFDIIKENQIEIEMFKYNLIEYAQSSKKFVPYLSVLDLIFNLGPDSKKIIRKGTEKIKLK